MLAFQRFQAEMGRHLRDPRRQPRPAATPARRMAVYRELLYNNLEGFLLACFPITRRILGDRRWPSLVRAFFREARCRTPYFREIPREFLDWLGGRELAGPGWLKELAHYEWVELAVDIMDTAPLPHDPAGDLMAGIPVPAPALMNLSYRWPVHRIGPAYRPRKPEQTHLLVYRDGDDEVQFLELNPLTSALVDLLLEGSLSGLEACRTIAGKLGHANPQPVIDHGARLLAELRAAGALLGVRS